MKAFTILFTLVFMASMAYSSDWNGEWVNVSELNAGYADGIILW